ncbi:MAG: hypothetical protein OXU94_07800 [Gammaproteobacteria bacterium]|nr:hypothetical protein [Gammaproteobacteria bacterium]
MPIPLTLVSEDLLSEIVARQMLGQAGKPYKVYNYQRWNKHKIQKKINKVNNSSRGFPYFVFTDQDTPEDCPPGQIEKHIRGELSPNLIYRFAVMEVESWVMAHRNAFAKFLSIPISRIPSRTDEIPDPKQFLVNLARTSRHYRLREDLVPAPRSTSSVGPGYNGRLSEFVQTRWRAEVAAQNSPSLARALGRLREFKPVYQNTGNSSGC